MYNKVGDSMRKHSKEIVTILIVIAFNFFVNISPTFAEIKSIEYGGTKYEYNDETQALYCGKQSNFFSSLFFIEQSKKDFNNCIKIDKSTKKYDEIVNYYIYDTDTILYNAFGAKSNVQLLTTPSDSVVDDDKLWWNTLRFCHSNNGANTTASLSTDYLSSSINENNRALFVGRCVTLTVQEVEEENKVNTCDALTSRLGEIYSLANEYSTSRKTTLLTKYKKKLAELRNSCSQVVKFSDYSDACMNICIDLEDTIYKTNSLFGISEKGECGFSARLIAWVLNILKWIKYIIPIVVVILGSLDFIKATGSDKDDDMKKAQGNFIKRLIAAALIFLIPLLIEFILPKFGFDYYSCGLF